MSDAKNGIPQVYVAIAAITEALSKEGIAKSGKNAQQGYSFRGIDQVYGALASLLATHQLCVIPRCTERIETERASKSGSALFSVTVAVEFDLVSAKDGSKHTARMYGEAMDSADKATNKAMSAAYKYMALEVFCIPTEGDNDADSTTHEVAAKRSEGQASGAVQGGRTAAGPVSRHGEIGVPGGPEKWDGNGGKPLTQVTTEVLGKVRKWLKDKDAEKNANLIAAIDEVVEARRSKAEESFNELPGALLEDDPPLPFERTAKAGAR